MGSIIRHILGNKYTRILLIVFLLLIAMASFYITSSYVIQLRAARDAEMSKLKTISNTLALQIDGRDLTKLFKTKPNKDDITANYQSSVYNKYHQRFADAKNANGLTTEIYTLTYDRSYEYFFFGITSADKPYYRHIYTTFPKELAENYEEGGQIEPYKDDHGYWISAFSPIRDVHGRTVAIVQVDEQFDSFIDEVRQRGLINIGISLLVFIIIGYFLLRTIRVFLRNEEKTRRELEISKKIIEEKNRQVLSSIEYAKRIQQAIMPPIEDLRLLVPEIFVIYKPKDIVSGDFYWSTQNKDGYIYLVCADCTGHGVPGALMSMIGSALINEIINVSGHTDPGDILDCLDKHLKASFKNDINTRDGMDVALARLNPERTELQFAGAYRPLVQISNGDVKEYKADRCSIESVDSKSKKGYTTNEIPVTPGDMIYLYTDGFPDQFGGPANRKLMNKALKQYLNEITSLTPDQQKEKLETYLQEWQGANKQIDDVLLIGFRI